MKKSLTLALMALLTVAMLASCASTGNGESIALETAPVENSEVKQVTDEEALKALFSISDKDLDVTQYRLRGEGPDGASFDWITVTEPKVAIADVRRGEWTLYAQALNADGDVIVSGKLDTFLSEDSPIDNLVLAPSEGTGKVQSFISWNKVQVRNPKVEVYMKSVDGDSASRDSSEIKYLGDEAVWEAVEIPAGSYIVRFVFKDGSTVIGGAAAALRVVAGYTAIGDVDMTIGNLNTVYGITIDNLPDVVTLGSLDNNNGVVTFTGNTDGNTIYEWYANGEKLDATGPVIDLRSFDLKKGIVRIDLIARNPQYGSINSYATLVEIDLGYNTYADNSWVKNVVTDADGSEYGVTPVAEPAVEPAETVEVTETVEATETV